MRKRVAFAATCVSLICCIAFTALYARATLNNLTASATENLLRLCRMSADYLDTAAFSNFDEDESGQLRSLAQDVGIGFMVLDENDNLVFDSKNTDAGSSTDEDIRQARISGSGTCQSVFRAKRIILASVVTDNGMIVRVWNPAPTSLDVFSECLGLLILTGIVLIALCFVLTSLLAKPFDRIIEGTENLLEAFSEGRFDERIGIYGHDAQLVKTLNASAERIEEQLRKQNGRNQALSAVMNQMQNGLLAVDSDYNVILLTSMAKTLLGIHEPWEKRPIGELSRDVNLESLFGEAMSQTGVYSGEIAVREGTSGRARTPLRLYVSPMIQDGKTVGAVAMIEDITEIRRLERIRTDFTANVSHELKTPLTSITGFVETLQEGAIDNPEMARKFLGIIKSEADRLTRLVNDILSISKLESGESDNSNDKPIQLDRKAEDVCMVLQTHAKTREVILSINESTEPVWVYGNNDRVEQLLINLIENAIKYNRQGGTVHVSVYGTEQNVYLLVSDTGIGIAEEHLPRLFERFYRVDKGRSRAMGGTGLGLAIVKHIVVSMGGSIEVHSKLGEGTEFSVTLPTYNEKESDKENRNKTDNYESEE